MALRLYALVALLSVLPLIVCAYLVAGGFRAPQQISIGSPDRSASAPHVFASGAVVADAPRAGVRSAQYAGFGPEAGDKVGRPPVVPQPVMPPPIVPVAPIPSTVPIEPPGAGPLRALDTVGISVPDPFQAAIFWEMPEMRLAVLAYLAIVALAVLVTFGILRSLKRFRQAADEIALGRVGDHALAGRSGVRELASVAKLLDRLVFDLRYMSDQMRLTAEENAHSLRTPLATMRTALGAVRRALPEEPRAQRALKIIDISLDRVSHVVNSAQRNDTTMADLVAAPRAAVDLGELARDTIAESQERAQSRNIRIRENLQDRVIVRASVQALEAALEDVLASAINASPSHGEIIVTLETNRTGAHLLVEDRGGGDEADLVFQHDFTIIPAEIGQQASDDSRPRRLGLWNVKRTVEAFGGQVDAQRNDQGGVVVSIVLPSNPQ